MLAQEIARAHNVQNQIEETDSFDGRTVMGLMGDSSLGSGLAKSAATDKANARLTQLEKFRSARDCKLRGFWAAY